MSTITQLRELMTLDADINTLEIELGVANFFIPLNPPLSFSTTNLTNLTNFFYLSQSFSLVEFV